MNIATIRSLVEGFDNHQLQQAEADLLEGNALAIPVDGSDEGEQLTHVLAALWVVQHMKESGNDVMTSIREYTKKVRSSISL